MSTLNDSCFAYPALRRFPINTKESMESSYGAYLVQKNTFNAAQKSIIDSNFTKAAAYYGVELQGQDTDEEERELLMFKGASEHVDMPQIRTVSELEQAVDFVLDKRASTARANLTEPAKYILWAASGAGLSLAGDKMRKIAHIAGMGVGNREKIQYELDKRAVMLQNAKSDREALWKYANQVRNLSDSDFFEEKTINNVCDTIDAVDIFLGNQHKQASELGYPEDIVFEETVDDLVKEAQDLYYVPSVDATLSKKATEERSDDINSFFASHFSDHERLDGEKLFNKVAALDAITANALLEELK